MRRTATLAAIGATGFGLLVGCGSAETSDAGVRALLARGVGQIRSTRDDDALHAKLLRTLARLRTVHVSTRTGERGRSLAVRGFASTLRGLESRIAFERNDSGNVAAATRDAVRADRALKRGATLLRAAGRALGVRVGSLNGY